MDVSYGVVLSPASPAQRRSSRAPALAPFDEEGGSSLGGVVGSSKRGSRLTPSSRSGRGPEGDYDEGASKSGFAAGMRRIQSSPSITVGTPSAGSSASRKKSTAPASGTVTAASKSARRLQKKAEAARVSRRKKKAHLESIEAELEELENRYAAIQRGGGAAHTSASRKKKSRRSSNSGLPPHSHSTPGSPAFPHTLSADGGVAIPGVLLPPSSAAPRQASNSLPDRFHTVLAATAEHFQAESAARVATLQQVSQPDGTLDLLLFLLSRAKDNGGLLPGLAHPSDLAPSSSSVSSPPATFWADLLVHLLDVPPSSLHALLSPSLGVEAQQLRDSFAEQARTAADLRQEVQRYLNERVQLSDQLWSGFRRGQKEVLASTGFKQQNQMHQMHQQQQHAQQQAQQHAQQHIQQQHHTHPPHASHSSSASHQFPPSAPQPHLARPLPPAPQQQHHHQQQSPSPSFPYGANSQERPPFTTQHQTQGYSHQPPPYHHQPHHEYHTQ